MRRSRTAFCRYELLDGTISASPPCSGTKAAYTTRLETATIDTAVGRQAPVAHYATNARSL